MRERFPHGYNYSKTFFRNLYGSHKTWGITGAGSLSMLETHAKVVGSVPNRKYRWLINPPETTYDPLAANNGVPIVAAVDMSYWIHTLVNNDTPSCKTSFVCTLVANSKIMSQEDLNVLIKHKTDYVRKTSKGRRQVSEYHRLGNVLENKMQLDPSYHWMCDKIYTEWLKDCVIAVKNNEADEAERLYNEMLDWLCARYKVERTKTW